MFDERPKETGQELIYQMLRPRNWFLVVSLLLTSAEFEIYSNPNRSLLLALFSCLICAEIIIENCFQIPASYFDFTDVLEKGMNISHLHLVRNALNSGLHLTRSTRFILSLVHELILIQIRRQNTGGHSALYYIKEPFLWPFHTNSTCDSVMWYYVCTVCECLSSVYAN